MKAWQKHLERVFPVLISLFLAGLLAGSALSQETKPAGEGTKPVPQKKELPEGSYVNKFMRFYILPPKGLEALPEEKVKEIALSRRKQGKAFEQLGDGPREPVKSRNGPNV